MIEYKQTMYLPLRSKTGISGFTKIDLDDYEKFRNEKLWMLGQGKRKYACTSKKHFGTRRFHRIILGVCGNELIDHANGDGLDNRKCNLRVATKQQNGWNMFARSARGVRGVTFDKRPSRAKKPWKAQIMVDRKQIWLGDFQTEEEATSAYDNAAKKICGEFARTNEMLQEAC